MAREELAILWIALQKQGLFVPRATVAEIIPYEPLQRLEDAPDWFLGLLGWRGEQVPVASYEMLSVERASFSLVSVSSASLVVLKGISELTDVRFYAMVSQTPPRELTIRPEMLISTGEVPGKTELAKVRFQNDVISVPDLDYIEANLGSVVNG